MFERSTLPSGWYFDSAREIWFGQLTGRCMQRDITAEHLNDKTQQLKIRGTHTLWLQANRAQWQYLW